MKITLTSLAIFVLVATGFVRALPPSNLLSRADVHNLLLERQEGTRSMPGNVPYGVALTSCTVPGTVALTFDDSPFQWVPISN